MIRTVDCLANSQDDANDDVDDGNQTHRKSELKSR